MFGLGDDDDDERYWNFIMFNMYATDEEMGEIGGVLIILVAIILVGYGIYCLFH